MYLKRKPRFKCWKYEDFEELVEDYAVISGKYFIWARTSFENREKVRRVKNRRDVRAFIKMFLVAGLLIVSISVIVHTFLDMQGTNSHALENTGHK